MHVNLALQRPVICSSERMNGEGSHAVDGEAGTFWQPLSTDRKDDNRVWITVDLGSTVSFNQIILKFASGFISGYQIAYSQDNLIWQEAYRKDASKEDIGRTNKTIFPRVNARYVKLEAELFDPERDFQLVDFGIYEIPSIPNGPLLASVYASNAEGDTFEQWDTLALVKGGSARLTIKGIMTDRTAADLTRAEVVTTCMNPEVVVLDELGAMTALKSGIAQVKSHVTLHGVTQEINLYVDVDDPSERIADLWLTHPSLVMEIGQPALLAADSEFPVLHILANKRMSVKSSLINDLTGEVIIFLPEREVEANTECTFIIPGYASQAAHYQWRIELLLNGHVVGYDAFYFTILDPTASEEGQNQIVYLNQNGKLAYVPDYKGNRVIDFSNAGYGGGGIPLPDVPIVLTIEPIEGDNTVHIQHALDRISALPLSPDGFRGAVLLRKGIYPVSGQLRIRASGVVLRGEGADEKGTLLYATGTMKRSVIDIQGASAPELLTETSASITDLYVPSGSRSLHVEDSSGFRPGDTVKVLRFGNERWIHAIGMDSIRSRPVTGGTVQWSPFELAFDRVITQIDGNCITLDAPIANAIEQRWGSGEIVKYDDAGRIERIGVEHLRIDVTYDPSVKETSMDGNEGSATYLADENHAITGVYIDRVKHAWVRNVAGFHLQHALVQVERDTKWTTVQDCAVSDFISIITGGRRYSFHLVGELALVQRVYSEGARHAFTVDSRVAGPNVFFDCKSKQDYNTSEPHHRWSVGCLYDNVNGRIHIQDRAWLGSGHGWAGANYVTWNTRNELVSQQPPTAQNYAFGHVGKKGKALLPNAYDPRPKNDAFWDSFGTHVRPRSLYLQQLEDRIGAEADEVK
ncbi:discoidin domain-containing protein [Paenibacillus sp. P36]|uniref:discoidin domain-containing protein n=1 Tax=Paenibacillus sp. P36 TaxID=3342538 RepID=UPI0038B352A0